MGSSTGVVPQTPMYTQAVGAGGAVGASGSASDPVNTTAAPLPAGTDRSGTTSAAAGTATQLAPANASRRRLEIHNPSAGNIGVNEIGGTAAIGAAGTYTIAPLGNFRVSTNRAISVVGSAASQAYTATES